MFQDEARFGRISDVRHCWQKKPHRPVVKAMVTQQYAYAYGAIGTHGLVKGGFLALRRLLKCHPWHHGDMIDPVPASIDWPDIISYNSVHRKQAGNCGCGHHQKKDKTHAKS